MADRHAEHASREPSALPPPAPPTPRRPLRRFLLFCVAALVIAALAFVTVVPGVTERRYNAVHPPAVPVPVTDADRALHARLVIVDLHADSLLWNRDLLERGTRGHVDVPRLIEGNVALQVFSAVTQAPEGGDSGRSADDLDRVTPLIISQLWPTRTWSSRLQRAMYQAFLLQDVELRGGRRFTFIRSAAGLQRFLQRRAKEPQLVAGLLALEGAQALEGSLRNLELLSAAGYRMLGLAHFTDNEVAGSVHGIGHGGLTDFGRQVVARAEALGMVIDVAHSSPRTIDDVLAVATRPVIASHTGVRGTADNPRNLSDAQLDGIARSGGLVGIGYWQIAVGSEDPRDIVRAIRYAADRIGVAHVALGSDFDGSVATPFDASGLVQLTALLHADGFSDDDIAALMGGNALALLAATLPPQ